MKTVMKMMMIREKIAEEAEGLAKNEQPAQVMMMLMMMIRRRMMMKPMMNIMMIRHKRADEQELSNLLK